MDQPRHDIARQDLAARGVMSRPIVILAASALALMSLMLLELYRQLPPLPAALLSVSAIWLGIASLFSP